MEIGFSQGKEPDGPEENGFSVSEKRRPDKDLKLIRQRIEKGYYKQPEIVEAVVDILIGRPELLTVSDK